MCEYIVTAGDYGWCNHAPLLPGLKAGVSSAWSDKKDEKGMVPVAFQRPEIIRPPSEWRSYYLPLTSGCSNNTCTFCNYFGSRLQLRKADEVLQEIDALALFKQEGIHLPYIPPIVYAVARGWDGRRVFLQDGDALVYPFPALKAILTQLNERFPRLERVGAYATARDILGKSPSELKLLKELKLGILYMGVESGDGEILQRVGKRTTPGQMVEAAKRVREAGIVLSVTVILGLGGTQDSRKHALATAEILSELDPDFAGALTLIPVPGTPLFEQLEDGRFELFSPLASLEELQLMIENARFTRCFFSSMHASNYFSLRGWLPGEKERMTSELAYVRAKKDSALLRPEYARGL